MDYGVIINRRPKLTIPVMAASAPTRSTVPQTPPTPVKKSSQIAKVHPFTVMKDTYQQQQQHGAIGGMGDLVAEIDADSSLVNHCLQEAELLEQQLTRKLKKQQVASGVARPTARSSQHRSIRSAFARPSSQDNHNSAATHTPGGSRAASASNNGRSRIAKPSASSNSRPPFK